jgi:hypothetical protein
MSPLCAARTADGTVALMDRPAISTDAAVHDEAADSTFLMLFMAFQTLSGAVDAREGRPCGSTHSAVSASSGKTSRHRLNRSGDRQANNALWVIAMVRLSRDPKTRAYRQRNASSCSSVWTEPLR